MKSYQTNYHYLKLSRHIMIKFTIFSDYSRDLQQPQNLLGNVEEAVLRYVNRYALQRNLLFTL